MIPYDHFQGNIVGQYVLMRSPWGRMPPLIAGTAVELNDVWLMIEPFATSLEWLRNSVYNHRLYLDHQFGHIGEGRYAYRMHVGDSIVLTEDELRSGDYGDVVAKHDLLFGEGHASIVASS